DVLSGNHHAPDTLTQTECGHTSFQALLDLLLKARIGMDDVPLLSHRHAFASVLENSEQAIEQPAHCAIHAEKEDAKKGHRDNQHKSGDDYLESPGPGDLTELHPHLVQELAPALWMFFDPFPKRPRA